MAFHVGEQSCLFRSSFLSAPTKLARARAHTHRHSRDTPCAMQETLLPIQPACRHGLPHALLLPYQHQGHISPLLTLASLLARSGILVTFVFSASNYSLLQQNDSCLEALQPRVRVEAVPDEVLPAEDGDGKAADPCFVHSMQKLEGGLEQLIRELGKGEHPVTCLVSDMLMPWTHEIASKFGIPRFEFCVFPALAYCLGYHTQKLIQKGYLPFKPGTEEEIIDFIPGLAPFRVADIPMDCLVADISHLQVVLRVSSHVKEAAGLVINSVDDLESNALEVLRSEQISVYPIGPLIPPAFDNNIIGSSRNENPPSFSLFPEDKECLKWLDGQADSSVVYVSFGSLASHSNDEIQELALGLEASQCPFLWVIRPDAVSGAISDILPVGFNSRTKGRGRIVSWAPQIAVLSHRSVGVFLSHCGWSSTLESLWTGVPIVGHPKLSDQNTNLKQIAGWKTGMPLGGREKMQGIARCSIEAAVKAMLHGEEGRAARKRIMELRETLRTAVAPGGSSEKSMQKLVEALKQKMAARGESCELFAREEED